MPRYATLETNYPDNPAPCDGGWANQCAIRLSIALVSSGFALTAYPDPLCSHGHARGAESLANYLWRQVGRPQVHPGRRARTAVQGRPGIVFFRNIIGFRGGVGDHIDLWDGAETMTGEYFTESTETWFWSVA